MTYAVASAEASGLPDRSCDAITVAQAVHWFNLPAFYLEARRVLKPGGVIAVWCYTLVRTGHADIDALLLHLQEERLGKYWPKGREQVEDHYRSLHFPFAPLEAPAFDMTAQWSQAEVLGYLESWSAVVRCREFERQDPLTLFAAELATVWPGDTASLTMRWPLHLRAGTNPV